MIIVRWSKKNWNKILKRKSSVKEVSEAEGRERNERKRQSGWERPRVAMETGGHQLTPCFPLDPPTSNSLSFRYQCSRHSASPFSPSLHLSIVLPSLHHSHTFFTFLPHTPASFSVYINHTLAASPLSSPPWLVLKFFPLFSAQTIRLKKPKRGD